jgi:ATP-binding cassette subfamily F protein uup
MDHLVDQLFVFEGEGKIRLFNGNYSDYRNWMEENQPVEEPEKKPTVSEQPQLVKSGVRKLTFKEKQELEHLPLAIEELEAEKNALVEKLNGRITDHEELTKLSKKIEEITQQIDEKSTRWLELSELV